MSITTSKELFINMKDVPQYNPKKHYYDQTKDVLDFYTEERNKILYGTNIGGFFIHPWLYWHINYFKTPIPTKENGVLKEKVIVPPLDDNILYITDTYKQAEEEDKGMFIFGSRGFGKALSDEELLLYEDKSWKRIGDSKVGDRIYGADGKLTTITGVYPQGEIDLYKITLRDGRTITCCDEHLWYIYDVQSRSYRILPLKEMLGRYKYSRKYTGNKYKDGKGRIAEVYNYYVPTNKNVDFSEESLPIDPYWLGLWLGDGDSTNTRIASIDQEIIEYTKKYAERIGLIFKKTKNTISYSITTGKKGKANPLRDEFKKLKLLGNKHIPDIYMKASYDQRMELLRGLMDSDGTITKQSAISFSQANFELNIQIRDLANSLGIHASVARDNVKYIKQDGSASEAWNTILYTTEPVFKLTRKLKRLPKVKTKGRVFRENHSAIVNITKVEKGKATCIRVDNKDKLFITTDYIVTHNSSMLSSLVSWLATTKENGTTSIIGGNDDDLGAISALLQTGLNKIHPAFHLPRLKSDWKSSVEFGIREKDNTKHVYSRFDIRNADDNKKKSTEKGAGLSPVGFIVDEALHEDTIIPTPNGDRTIKQIQEGDTIWGANGKPTKVLSKINPGVVPVFKITFADDRHIIVSDNHKWKVWDTTKQEYRILTTRGIREKYYYEKLDKRYNKVNRSYRYAVPINEPLDTPEKNLPVDPYWLGLWLGDGEAKSTTVSTPDIEIRDYCIKYSKKLGLGHSISEDILESGLLFYRCSIIKKEGRNNLLRDKLRDLGCFGEKNIPSLYLKGSIEQRLNLLRGLFDTDGSVTEKGSIEFTTSIEAISEGVKNILWSLGISFKLTERIPKFKYKGVKKEGKKSYRFNIRTDLEVFTLDRHLSRYYNISQKKNNNTKKREAYRTRNTIIGIERAGEAQVYCIGVDNSNKLFLAGDYIVTHNCGKFSFLEIFKSALPSFMTEHGAKLVPTLSGTGGNTELSKDARTVMQNPVEYQLLMLNLDRLNRNVPEEAITWKDSKESAFCTFVPGQMSYRLDVPKVEKRLTEYLNTKHKDLGKIKIRATDWIKATNSIEERRLEMKREDSINKHKMYYPTKTEHCFLTESPNPFPTAIIAKRIEELEASGKIGKSVSIYKDGGKYKYEFSSKKRADVSHPGGTIDAPIILFEEIPDTPPEKYVYVGGHDGYKIDVSGTDSLGSTYVIKRRNTAPNEPCERIAVSITTRPEKMRNFLQDSEIMIKAWNAVTNMESIDVGLQHHLETKKLEYEYLCPAFSFTQKTSKFKTKLNSKFGLFPNAGNNAYRFNSLVDWCWEEHTMGLDEDNNPVTKYSVEFIDDVDLLKEMRDYKPGNNVDRITAFSHALVYAQELDKDRVQPSTPKEKKMTQKDLAKKAMLTRHRRYGGSGHKKY